MVRNAGTHFIAAAAFAMAAIAGAGRAAPPREERAAPPPAPAATPATQPSGAAAPAPSSPSAERSVPGATGPLSQADLQHATADLNRLHQVNAMETEAARLAAQKASSQAVKDYAQRMLKEHGDLDQQVIAIARERGITLSNPTTDAVHQASLARLRTLSGTDFDRAFVDAMLKDHDGAVAETKAMRDHTPGHDPKLKKFLDDTENTMESHLNMTREARRTLQAGQRMGRRPGER